MLGPVPCQGCRQPVTWSGYRWRNVNRSAHHCAGPRCGSLMPQAHERCARTAGHRHEHRSPYALANAARARRKWAA
jgi:hypothetical protein